MKMLLGILVGGLCGMAGTQGVINGDYLITVLAVTIFLTYTRASFT